MRRRIVGAALIAVCAAALGALYATAASSSAQYIYVTRTDDPPQDGCDLNGCSLREGADLANATAGEQIVDIEAGDTVALTQGPISITGDVRIAGHDGSGVTSTGARLLEVEPGGDAAVENLRLFGADADGCGGAIRNEGTLDLTNVTVDNNMVDGTGGGLCNTGSATLDQVTFTGNEAVGGPGGAIYSNYSLFVNDSTVSANTVSGENGGGDGAGIANGSDGVTTVMYSTISGNTATSPDCDDCSSGAGFSNEGELVVDWSTISDNNADTGAGMENGGHATIRRTTLSGNQAGAILNTGGGTMSISNSTISGNLASPYPDNGIGGISNYGTLSLTNATIADNTNLQFQFGGLFNGTTGGTDYKGTIFSNNGQKNCNTGGTHISAGYNVFDDDTCATKASDQVVGDAMIGPLADNGGPTLTRNPLAGSPAIDKGSPGCPSPDQRGALRVGPCDVGAVEYGSEPPTPTPTPSPTPAPDAFPMGDASCDDRVDEDDIAAHLGVVAGIDEPDDCGRDTIPCIEFDGECYPAWLDTDCDGDVDGADALWVMFYVLTLFEEFDGCTPVGDYPAG